MKQRALYKRVEAAAKAQRLDAAAVEGLSAQAMRLLAGAEGEPVTATLLGNIQRSLAVRLRQKEMDAAAVWIEAQARMKFPAARAQVCGAGRIEVRLDGLSREEQ